nr:MAG TPA: hypothetical protein [Caudoviricetes sp.]
MRTKRARRSWIRRPFSRTLIEESDLAYLLYTIFWEQGTPPGIVFGTRTQNEPVTPGERAFMLACARKALEDGNISVKIRNLSGKKAEGA